MPVPHLSAAGLLLAATILAGADAPPAIYRQVGDGPPQTLLLDPDHAILVDGQGLMLWSMRLVREADGSLVSYQWGRPTGSRLTCDGASADATLANGSTLRFVRQMDAGGQDWGPLPLAPAASSRAVRAAVAADLRRLVEAERSAAAALTRRLQSPGFTGAYASLPENQVLLRQRDEARAWLRRTLQTSGWISAEYGAQALADLAELSSSVANDLRLLRTLQAGAQAALAAGGAEADAVALLDLAASTLGDPPPYGSLVLMRPAAPRHGRAASEVVIPIPADRAAVDGARSRAGLPTLAQFASSRQATVVAIAADGREGSSDARPR
ncbi:MAG: hypothetical protein J0M02_08460 [Planctomycetes bacterium]|nr:hypothetical protein [Planctomycetota bacterium]